MLRLTKTLPTWRATSISKCAKLYGRYLGGRTMSFLSMEQVICFWYTKDLIVTGVRACRNTIIVF